MRTVTARVLERFGFTACTAPDRREALAVFREHADAIASELLDMTMPHLNGADTFRILRQLKPDVRVILMSGYNEQEATSRFAGKGLAGFLHKPFSPRELGELLRQLIAPA